MNADPRNTAHALNGWQNLTQIASHGAFTDAQILCKDGGIVPANRLVLAVKSVFFQRAFEAQSAKVLGEVGGCIAILAPEDDAETVRLAIQYIHYGAGAVAVPRDKMAAFETLLFKWQVKVEPFGGVPAFPGPGSFHSGSGSQGDDGGGRQVNGTGGGDDSRPTVATKVPKSSLGFGLENLKLTKTAAPSDAECAHPAAPSPRAKRSSRSRKSSVAGAAPAVDTAPIAGAASVVGAAPEAGAAPVAKKTKVDDVGLQSLPSTSAQAADPAAANGLPVARKSQTPDKSKASTSKGKNPVRQKNPGGKFEYHPTSVEDDLVHVEGKVWRGRRMEAPHTPGYVCEVCGVVTPGLDADQLTWIKAHVKGHTQKKIPRSPAVSAKVSNPVPAPAPVPAPVPAAAPDVVNPGPGPSNARDPLADDDSLSCPICGRHFTRKSIKMRHMNIWHTAGGLEIKRRPEDD